MAIDIKYIGTQSRWPELATTGKQSIWFPGQEEERPDGEAALLIATGLFTRSDQSLNGAESAAARLLAATSGIPWASRPSAASNSGSLAWFDLGAGLSPVLMRSDGSYWRLVSTTVLIDNNTTVAGIASVAEQIIKQVTIPAGLLMSLRGFSVSHLASKVGANGAVTTQQYRLGTAGTTADASIHSTGAWSSATSLNTSGGRLLRATSATNLRIYAASVNTPLEAVGQATPAWPVDLAISNSDSSDLILSLTVTAASALDTPSGQRLTLIGW